MLPVTGPLGREDISFRTPLEFQFAEVQTRITALRVEHPREQGELAIPYASRLGRQGVAPVDASFLAYGEADPRVVDQLIHERSLRNEGRQESGERSAGADGAVTARRRGCEQRARSSRGL